MKHFIIVASLFCISATTYSHEPPRYSEIKDNSISTQSNPTDIAKHNKEIETIINDVQKVNGNLDKILARMKILKESNL